MNFTPSAKVEMSLDPPESWPGKMWPPPAVQVSAGGGTGHQRQRPQRAERGAESLSPGLLGISSDREFRTCPETTSSLSFLSQRENAFNFSALFHLDSVGDLIMRCSSWPSYRFGGKAHRKVLETNGGATFLHSASVISHIQLGPGSGRGPDGNTR